MSYHLHTSGCRSHHYLNNSGLWPSALALIMISRLFSLFLWLALSLTAFAAERPLNVLVLYADDWRHDTLGIAGNPVVQTPELDRLAGEGLRFTRAAVTTSICGVSRATLFTGMWMSRHGNEGFGPFKTPWAETYPGLLRTHGYWVGHFLLTRSILDVPITASTG
jgi:arylsulfatase